MRPHGRPSGAKHAGKCELQPDPQVTIILMARHDMTDEECNAVGLSPPTLHLRAQRAQRTNRAPPTIERVVTRIDIILERC
jgi:hypothetical protein